jgi:hypothetical protein
MRLLLYSVPLPMFSLMARMITGNRRESSPNAVIFLVGVVAVDDDIIVVANCTLYIINTKHFTHINECIRNA